ncbi:hypothetical protein N7603_08385, partial [Acholeplasma vituli]
MKKWIYLLLLVAPVLILSSCTESLKPDGGRAPVYQGMIISSSNINQTSNFNHAILTSLISNDGDQMSIDDEIKDDIDVIDSGEVEYFAVRNQDVLITVKLVNPDSQVILRFTLNGVTYQSFQFQEGSDSENLILKVNAGDVSGVKEFTIDEIKYIENVTNETRDAVFEGDRTVKLGVTYGSVPTATIINSDINATSITLNITITDESDLIDKAGNTIKAYLYNGSEIIDTKDLVLGSNLVRFEKLPFDSEYEYAIATVYDSLDGLGNRVGILHRELVRTKEIITIYSISSTQSSIFYDLNINDMDQVGAVSAIELYRGETLIEALTDLSVREFTGLLSNNEYTIKVTYTYDLNDGAGSQALVISQATTTMTKATPTVVIDNVLPTQTSIGFGITVTDGDQVGSVSAIELYRGETLIEALTDLSVREFTGLLSNNEYTIKVTYTYDL